MSKPFRRGLGCNRDPPHKDAPRLLSREQIEKLPASYMLKDLTPVGDQGNEGSCTGNAGDNVYKIRDAMINGTFVNGARQQIYQCALAHDGNPFQDVGSSLSTIAWVLQNVGVAPESEFPYTGGMQGAVPTAVLNDAKKHEATKELRLDATDETTTIANVKAAPNAVIQSSYPVMFGFDVPESFFNTGSSGNMPTPSGGIAGGHANVFIGYDDAHTGNYDGSKGAFYIKNSWGSGWGANGYWYMPYSFFLDTDDGVGDCWAIINTSDFNPSPTPGPAPVAADGSNPATCVVNGTTYAFGRGLSNALYYAILGGNTWKSLGGTLSSGVAAVTVGNDAYIFGRGANKETLYYRTLTKNWVTVPMGTLVATSAPAVTASNGIIALEVRGGDKAVWYVTLNTATGAFGKWTSLGGQLN